MIIRLQIGLVNQNETTRYRWFSKKKVIDDIKASLTGTTSEQSASGRKNNSDFLQEAEYQ